jgi:flavin-dependent dehydrogenase
MPHDVLIAGAGVAAAAVASRLIDARYRVLLLRNRSPAKPGTEVLPPAASAQIEALGWAPVFVAARAITVEGFENCWNLDEPVVKPGPFLHVERAALAHAALAFVVRRGATVHDVRTLPALGPEDDESVSVRLDSVERRFLAAVDATGRAAAWSRPVRGQGRHVADLFEGPAGPSLLRGRVVSDLGRDRWAYRVGLPGSTTVGVVTRDASRRELDPSLARALGVPAADFRFAGRRPSFPQWAAEPGRGRRLAVGDAAFASDPLAGQGIRFAMASGLAAAAAVDALARSADLECALDYYREFVSSARARHLLALANLRAGPSAAAPSAGLPASLRFTARPRLAALNVEGTLDRDVAYELPDGALVRWLGGFDLRRLARLATHPIPAAELSQKLQAEGLSPTDARTLLSWCINHNILTQ